jgi:hypothetical protein
MPEPLPGSGDEAEESMRKNPVLQYPGKVVAAFVVPALAIVLALAVAGCGRNGGDLPAGFTPTGVSGQDNVLIVEVAAESTDVGTAVPLVRAQVFDRTNADGYRLYRQAGDTGFDTANDYVSEFTGTFNQGYETYSTTDRNWQSDVDCRYVARATLQGEESGLSPLTNYAAVPAGDFEDLLAGSFLTTCPIDTMATDSLPLLVWEPVTGAVRYLIKIWRTDGRVFFFGLTPSTGVTSYQLASGAGTVLQEVPLSQSPFFWTVVAIDADWRVIARSGRQIFVYDPEEAKPPCTP